MHRPAMDAHRPSMSGQPKPPLPPIPSGDTHKPIPPQKPPIPPARPSISGPPSGGPPGIYYKALYNFLAEYPEELSLEVSWY